MDTKGKTKMRVTGNPARRKAKQPERPRKEPQIQIHYTPAKPFNRNRFLLRLATVAAAVLALFLVLSIFFKVDEEKTRVSGAEKYTPWEVWEASGLQDGDALLSLSEAKISARIKAALPYVGDVRVGIKLPDTVNIEVTELSVVYAIESNNSAWWLIDSEGRIVDASNAAMAMNHTRITGVQIMDAVIGQQAVAAEESEPTEESTEASGEESMPTVPLLPAVSPRHQLDAAVQILTALEENGMMGRIDTVDVSDTKQLTMWYGSRYQVMLGDTSKLSYKISAMKAAIQKMGGYQNGYLDVSFTTWPNEVGFTPFDGNGSNY